ncbi:CcmD family protein [Fulvivirga lutea]|uniref:CcmD family protein n=1 Tax=Fulvivirga lutea TaxID=2810512 RepID=A0A974WLI0_9BACT|nr:CcmD family protein [Fulvivirga lutea]QSE98420.1 CcmD family protein [Fulvivirga lutea]
MKKWLLILMMFATSFSFSQEKIPVTESDYQNSEVPMADRLREDGKIYVLTGIIMIILIGTLGYLVVIDKKISRVEKTLENKQ